MNKEIEAKFLNVDFDTVRKKLKALGANLEQPMRLMRRALIDTPQMAQRDAFVRIRDEGDKSTLTYKEFKSHSLHGVHEREVIISDFEDTLSIFAECGLTHRSFQESKRETWKLGEAEVVLDEWPWLNPYIEIEAPSEELVKQVSKQLEFLWEEAVFGSVDQVYKIQYPHMKGRGVIDLKEVRFDMPLPVIFQQD